MDRSGEPLNGARGVVGPRIEELIVGCIEAVGVDGGGLSLVTPDGAREPLFGSDDTAIAMERLQLTLGEGPCVDASLYGSPVLVGDLQDHQAGVDDRWPIFLGEAMEVGVRAVFAFPVHIGAVSLGAVDLYRRAPGPLRKADLAKAMSVADAVALALLDADGSLDAGVGMEEMSSLVVHRAAGMVMVQLGCSIDEALMRLRATAYSEGSPIQQVATDVVRGDRRFQEEEQ